MSSSPLSTSVIGEGVETEDTLQLLTEFGCDYAQGYGLHRPAPRQQVLAAILGGDADAIS